MWKSSDLTNGAATEPLPRPVDGGDRVGVALEL
jgi:hypothetical protein